MKNVEALLGRYADMQTILGKETFTSVKVNGVFIRADSLHSRLRVFGQNLARYTHVKDYEVQLIGSATGLSYRGVDFLVCTAHQLKDISAEDVGIIMPVKNSFITSAGYTRARANERMKEGDAGDLCALDFTPQTFEHPDLAQRFFPLKTDDILLDGDRVLNYLAYGCPFDDQKYEIVDKNHVGTVIRAMTCDSGDTPNDPALSLCRTVVPMNFDPNGLSGGPVFAIVLHDTELSLRFAGIINRAGGGLIHFLKARLVQRLLDLAVDQEP